MEKKKYTTPHTIISSIIIESRIMGTSRENWADPSDSDAKQADILWDDDDTISNDLWDDEEEEF